jgi:esterase/lipase superfamily enzyme
MEAERRRRNAELESAERHRAEEAAQKQAAEAERQRRVESVLRELQPMELDPLSESTLALERKVEEAVRQREAPGRVAQPTPPFVEVPVFYGTNRAKAGDGVWYGVDRGGLRFGRCLVTVPTDRRIGTIPRPSIWTLYREKPDRHYILTNVEESTGKEDFARGLRESIQHYARRQVLVFVHGFNVTFADAVFRTAQIAADLNFHGAPVLFSWPSKGTLHPLGYTHDETQARWALPDLRAFLELIAEQSGADAIHLLAHSMGNRAMTEALCQIAASTAKRSRAPFNELMLTAPDIDADTFVRDIAPAMLPASARVTLYASSNDRALAFSKTVHGYPRAGESGEALVLVEGIDTIDVSAVDTNFVGHFYYGDNRSVLSDLFNLIQGQAAERRFGLRPRKKNDRSYWVFQP